MDILRNLFGNLTSGIIRLAVAVGILAAAYFFIVKPVLNTTDKAIDSANRSWEQSFGTTGAEVTDVAKTLEEVNLRVQREVRKALKNPAVAGDSRRMLRCIERANGDVTRIERCARRF